VETVKSSVVVREEREWRIGQVEHRIVNIQKLLCILE
jgi:hypothetical protein